MYVWTSDELLYRWARQYRIPRRVRRGLSTKAVRRTARYNAKRAARRR